MIARRPSKSCLREINRPHRFSMWTTRYNLWRSILARRFSNRPLKNQIWAQMTAQSKMLVVSSCAIRIATQTNCVWVVRSTVMLRTASWRCPAPCLTLLDLVIIMPAGHRLASNCPTQGSVSTLPLAKILWARHYHKKRKLRCRKAGGPSSKSRLSPRIQHSKSTTSKRRKHHGTISRSRVSTLTIIERRSLISTWRRKKTQPMSIFVLETWWRTKSTLPSRSRLKTKWTTQKRNEIRNYTMTTWQKASSISRT